MTNRRSEPDAHRVPRMSPRARGTGSDRLLAVLQEHPGVTVAARDLMAAADIATLTSLRTHISSARRALGGQADRLQSIREAGYRWDQPQPSPAREHELALDLELHSVAVDGRSVQLTNHRIAILRALTDADDQALSAAQLRRLTRVSSDAAVKIHVSELRKELQELEQIEIITVRGHGYRYVGPPAYCRTPCREPPGGLHVNSDGQVLRDGRPLRLRRREHVLLELLLEHTGQPVRYAELLAYAHIPDISELQTAISCIRTALRDSPIHVVHCRQGSNAYTLRVSAH